MKDYKINNIFDLNKEDIISLLNDLENEKIIPKANKTLKAKLNLIISHTAFVNNISLEYDIKKFEEINHTDYNLIKNYLLNYYKENDKKYFIEDKIIKKQIKLSLSYIFKEFLNEHKDLKNDSTEIVSIKLYDYFKDEVEKDKSLDLLDEIFNLKSIKNINIVSNINTLKSYDFFKNVLIDNEDAKIKYMYKVDNQYSYISSVFYMIMKFKIATNYKSYFLYFEPDVNWGYSTNSLKNDFSNHFLDLLEIRFENSFNYNYVINFDKNIFSKESFDVYFEEIVIDINNFLSEEPTINEDDIFKKIAYLKLYYPKIDLSYKLIRNVVKNIVLVKEIKNKKLLQNIPNTEKVIIKMQKEHILRKINIMYNDVVVKNNNSEIDIFLLRKSIFINKIGNSNMAICDIFNYFKWSNLEEILTSFDDIYYTEHQLNKFYKKLCIDNFLLVSFDDKQKEFENIVDKYIMKGKKIPDNLLLKYIK